MQPRVGATLSPAGAGKEDGWTGAWVLTIDAISPILLKRVLNINNASTVNDLCTMTSLFDPRCMVQFLFAEDPSPA